MKTLKTSTALLAIWQNLCFFNLLFNLVSTDQDLSFEVHDTVPECKLANGKLHRRNEPLSLASDKMWKQFDATCDSTSRCLMDVGNETSMTHLNYMGMRETDAYANVRKACNDLGTAEKPTTLCKVNSHLKVPGENTITFVSKREPICFHYDCGNHQVEFVDPRPLGCNPEAKDCVVSNEIADCPERPKGAGLGNCMRSQPSILDDETYSNAKDILNIELGAYCKGEKENPVDDPICTYEIEPIPILVSQNFRHYETDPVYKDYAQECYAAGGQTCFLSLNTRSVGKVLLYDLDVTGDYNDFPMCFPSTCEHDVKEAMAKELLTKNLANKIAEAVRKFSFRRSLLGDEQDERVYREMDTIVEEDNGESCPFGMEKCSTVISDFYCTGSDGEPVDPSETAEQFFSSQQGEVKFRSVSLNAVLISMVAVVCFVFFMLYLYAFLYAR